MASCNVMAPRQIMEEIWRLSRGDTLPILGITALEPFSERNQVQNGKDTNAIGMSPQAGASVPTIFRVKNEAEEHCKAMHSPAIRRACLLLLAFVGSALAESQSTIAAKHLPPQVQLINGVLVPVPNEIFRVLDTFQDANWHSILRPNLSTLRPDGSPARIALSLGLVFGEGFLAVSAKDADEMQNLGRTAVKLSRALGVGNAVLRREKSVMEHVDREDWEAVRKEWSVPPAKT